MNLEYVNGLLMAEACLISLFQIATHTHTRVFIKHKHKWTSCTADILVCPGKKLTDEWMFAAFHLEEVLLCVWQLT